MGKREVIFNMPSEHGEYRVVCRFGYDRYIYYEWWGHLEKKFTTRKFLWIKPKQIWIEIDYCRFSKEISTMEQLKDAAMKFYDDNIEAPIRVNNKAMNLK